MSEASRGGGEGHARSAPHPRQPPHSRTAQRNTPFPGPTLARRGSLSGPCLGHSCALPQAARRAGWRSWYHHLELRTSSSALLAEVAFLQHETVHAAHSRAARRTLGPLSSPADYATRGASKRARGQRASSGGHRVAHSVAGRQSSGHERQRPASSLRSVLRDGCSRKTQLTYVVLPVHGFLSPPHLDCLPTECSRSVTATMQRHAPQGDRQGSSGFWDGPSELPVKPG